MNLAILQPCYKYINSSSYIANLVFYSELVSNNIKPLPIICDRTFINEARSQIVKKVVDEYDNIDICLWIDNDHQFTGNELAQLLNTMQENKLNIVSGAYLKRDDKEEVICAMKETKEGYQWIKNGNGVHEVDVIGLGFCLIKKGVLKDMWDKYKADLFETKCVDKENLIFQGEDVTFCNLLKKEGYKIHIDLDCNIGHYGFNLFPKTKVIK